MPRADLNLILISGLQVEISRISTYLLHKIPGFPSGHIFPHPTSPECKSFYQIWTKIMYKSWGKNKKIKGEDSRVYKYSGYNQYIKVGATSQGIKREQCLQTFVFLQGDHKAPFEWFHICSKDWYRRTSKDKDTSFCNSNCSPKSH